MDSTFVRCVWDPVARQHWPMSESPKLSEPIRLRECSVCVCVCWGFSHNTVLNLCGLVWLLSIRRIVCRGQKGVCVWLVINLCLFCVEANCQSNSVFLHYDVFFYSRRHWRFAVVFLKRNYSYKTRSSCQILALRFGWEWTSWKIGQLIFLFCFFSSKEFSLPKLKI